MVLFHSLPHALFYDCELRSFSASVKLLNSCVNLVNALRCFDKEHPERLALWIFSKVVDFLALSNLPKRHFHWNHKSSVRYPTPKLKTTLICLKVMNAAWSLWVFFNGFSHSHSLTDEARWRKDLINPLHLTSTRQPRSWVTVYWHQAEAISRDPDGSTWAFKWFIEKEDMHHLKLEGKWWLLALPANPKAWCAVEIREFFTSKQLAGNNRLWFLWAPQGMWVWPML